MQVEGTATVNICANSLMCSIDAVISSDLRDDLLVGCEDLRKLKIIPANFPHQTVRTEPNARQRRPAFRLRPAGDEHSSDSDEELLDSLTNAYFKPVKCSEEEDSGDPDQSWSVLFASPPSPLTFRIREELS